MEPSAFALASNVVRTEGRVFRATIPDGWQQGRGAFGGLVLGTLARAMQHAHDGRRLRSLSGELCAPVVPGDARIEVRTLRGGKYIAYESAHLLQTDGEIAARASAVFSSPREIAEASAIEPSAPAGSLASWQAVEPVDMNGPWPVFARHYEYRSTGPALFSGAEAISMGWVREADAHAGGSLDAPALVALLDAWWPAIFSSERQPRAVATIAFTAELFVDASTLPRDVPLFYTARAVTMKEGFFLEMRELWSGGRVVAMNQQTFAILT